MDDLAHESLSIHDLSRKRKAAQDDRPVQDAPPPADDARAFDPAATPRGPIKQQDHRALLAAHPIAAWPQPPPARPPSSPGRAPRARSGPASRYPTPRPAPAAPARPAASTAMRCPPRAEPGPSRGSLLRVSSVPSTPRASASLPITPLEPFAAHIPPLQPPINRETLKELNPQAIFRNPQLRHDLLFDPGLQFRPTSSRRKREAADAYWLAVLRELECGCTCSTVDAHGRPCERVCVCGSVPKPTTRPLYAHTPDGRITVRVPSRIRPLLLELREVLVSIIQPVMSRTTGLYVNPPPLHPQFQQNEEHVALLRSVLDAELIQQEMDHNLFDPSSVFQTIGNIIRCHCAPMRDSSVAQMVELAKQCAPGAGGNKVDAVRAIRLCFEIMELMKLDIANHQLQTLRPYLMQSASQYELKTFREGRQKGQLSLDGTREWLQSVHRELACGQRPLPGCADFTKLPQRTQIELAVTSALVDLVFDPPSPTSSPSSPSAPAPTPSAATPATPLPPSPSARTGFPETLYLDHARLATLATDAADFTALYMLLMLFRQLSLSPAASATPVAAPRTEELAALKRELWEIGPPHLGACFRHTQSAQDERWQRELSDVLLQVARRAHERAAPGAADKGLDEGLVKLAGSWAQTNLRADAPLAALMRRRVRDQVRAATVQRVVPPKGDAPEGEMGSGLEPLAPEVQHLADRIAKLAAVHLNVYGTLYLQPGFMADWSGGAPTRAA
ncbi:Tcp11-domain-containing protein [Wolfiporia cocos MD-104 SS10]|uniref:Tcp11-domain-containing protein n=1 Tax=Wolfiporia cocos (strain MD-104) TaxID=742152 RepID=A0A2H3JCV6_WOLCO|nr:Tcp11-domain-containing protein [Wolfiporia cocos MD-104 SS10]